MVHLKFKWALSQSNLCSFFVYCSKKTDKIFMK